MNKQLAHTKVVTVVRQTSRWILLASRNVRLVFLHVTDFMLQNSTGSVPTTILLLIPTAYTHLPPLPGCPPAGEGEEAASISTSISSYMELRAMVWDEFGYLWIFIYQQCVNDISHDLWTTLRAGRSLKARQPGLWVFQFCLESAAATDFITCSVAFFE